MLDYQFDISRIHEFMKFGNIKTKNSRIQVLPRLARLKKRLASLRKGGMVLIGLIFASFVLAQIPYEEGKVYVCPLATKKEEVNPKCSCRIDLILNETVTSTCPVNGESYEMTLTITDCGEGECYAILGFVNGGAGVNFPPQAKISAPSEAYVGKDVLFDASQSFDPNGDPLDFLWDFGDGNSGQGEKISHHYQREGEYLVSLTVFDGLATSVATTTIKIIFMFLPPQKATIQKETQKEIAYSEPKQNETQITSKIKIETSVTTPTSTRAPTSTIIPTPTLTPAPTQEVLFSEKTKTLKETNLLAGLFSVFEAKHFLFFFLLFASFYFVFKTITFGKNKAKEQKK
jgi:hypothetical protein